MGHFQGVAGRRRKQKQKAQMKTPIPPPPHNEGTFARRTPGTPGI